MPAEATLECVCWAGSRCNALLGSLSPRAAPESGGSAGTQKQPPGPGCEASNQKISSSWSMLCRACQWVGSGDGGSGGGTGAGGLCTDTVAASTLMRPPATPSNPASYQPALIEFISQMLVCIMFVYCTHVTIRHVVLAVGKILLALATTKASKHHPTPLALNMHTQLRRISPYDSGTCKHAPKSRCDGSGDLSTSTQP